MAQTFTNTILSRRDIQDYSSPQGPQLVFSVVAIGDVYPAGGYAVTPSDFGLTSIKMAFPFPTVGSSAAAMSVIWAFDSANSKLRAYSGMEESSDEVATGATMVNASVPVIVIGA